MGHGAIPQPDPRKPGPLPPVNPPILPADDPAKTSPLDVACPNCNSHPGEPCTWWPIKLFREFHIVRIATAREKDELDPSL